MKNKKGFTLIELLAVIVILAIIALIAIPIVLNMINNARKKAAESSAYGFVEAIEYNNGFAQTEQAGYTEINGTDLDATTIDVKVKGKRPTSGTITIENGKVTSANLCVEGYTVVYNGKEVASTTKGCSGSSNGGSTSGTFGNSGDNGGSGTTNEPNSIVTTIDTCPGCKFIYTTDEFKIGTDLVPAEATPDYTQLAGHPYFIGLIPNSSNVIARAFVCGIEGTTPFCFEGYDATKYADPNIGILNSIFNNCDSDDSYMLCEGSSIIAYTGSDGLANVQAPGDGEDKYCYSNIYGFAGCE